MAVAISVAVVVLRAGVAVRRARKRGRGRIPDLRRAHLRLARPAVAVIALGFLFGPLSMWLFRGRTPFDTLHSVLGSIALALFLATAWQGRRLERGEREVAGLHGRLGLVALIAAGAAMVAGFVLLP